MLFPSWFPFHLDKVAYWSTTVMVPLFIICTLKAKAKNPKNINILELFVTHPDKEQHYFPERTLLNKVFLGLDQLGRKTRPLIPNKTHDLAINKAKAWIIERLNGEDGLGGIGDLVKDDESRVDRDLAFILLHGHRIRMTARSLLRLEEREIRDVA